MEPAAAARLLGAVAVMALLLWGIGGLGHAALGRRLSLGSRGKVVSVVETTLLPNSAALHIVKVAQRYYLLGRSGAHIATLCEIDAAAFVPTDEPRPAPSA